MSAKCRDKFLVQSTLITPDRENHNLNDLWGVVEKEDKGSIHEQKIRCAFLPAATAPVPEEEENSMGGDEKYSTVNGGSYNPVTAASNAAGNADGGAPEKARVGAMAAGGAVAAGAGAAALATKNAVVGGSNDKSSSEMQAEVKRLRAQVAELQKGGGQASGGSDSGVPIHMVAALAFAVFALTYLFF